MNGTKEKIIIIKMKHLILFFTATFTLSIIYSCSKKENGESIPNVYNGYAILQTKDLPDDGVDLYTFFLMPKINDENFNKEINYNRQLSGKSITFIFTQGTNYLKYKTKLYLMNWDYDEDLILVKVNYELLVSDWQETTNVKTKKITIESKEYTAEDYGFINLVNNKGDALYRINNIEIIKKIN